MKKLVTLNAILLAILFSIKFSQEDLNQHLCILTKNSTLFRRENVAKDEYTQNLDFEEPEIITTSLSSQFDEIYTENEDKEEIPNRTIDKPSVVLTETILNEPSDNQNEALKSPIAQNDIKLDSGIKFPSFSIKTWFHKICGFLNLQMKNQKIALPNGQTAALIQEEKIDDVISSNSELIPPDHTNTAQTERHTDPNASLSTNLATTPISQEEASSEQQDLALKGNEATENNDSLSKAPSIVPSNPAWISKIHSFKSIPTFGIKSDPLPADRYVYNPYPIPKRLALSHTEGCGEREKEYRTNYSLLEILFAGDAKLGTFLPMIDLRGYRFDNAKYALSIGFMGRYIPEPNTFCELLGVNVYYDYAPGTCGYNNQLGGGLEILGKRWDIRANIYAPLGDNGNSCVCCDHTCINGWFAYAFNAEVGYLAVRSKSFLLYTAIGPYYITASECEERKRGVMLRVVPQYKDYLALNLKLSYDPIFKAIFQAEIIISLPLYQIRVPEKGPCGITNRQIYQRVERL